MTSDLDMLAILGNRHNYERFYPHVQGNFLTREGEVIGKSISEYFEQDVLKNTKDLNWPKFAAWFLLKHPMMGFEQKDTMKKVFENLDKYKPGDETFVQKILSELTVKHFAKTIAETAMGIADGSENEELSVITDMVHNAESEMSELQAGDDPHHVTDDFTTLFTADPTNQRLRFSLPELDAACGPYGRGNLIVIGAHPDTGKTTFLLGEAGHALTQLTNGQDILYFNNEQAGQDMKIRLASTVLQLPRSLIESDPVKYYKDFQDAGGERIFIYDKSYMNIKFCAERMKRHEGNIGMIIFDQLWKIRGASKSQNDFMQVAQVFGWARDVCKQHAPVLAVHQADGNTFGEKYLGMEHLFGSRIAVQGEADAVVMIGRMTDGSQRPDLRHFNVPKNKLSGNDPLKRNNKFDAFIDHELVKFKGVL